MDAALWADTFRSQKHGFLRGSYLRGMLQGVFAGFEEPEIISNADHVWASSSQVAAVLGKLSGENIFVVPNPIPNSKLLDIHISTDRYRDCNVVFVGHFQYPPNKHATNTLVNKLIPMICLGYWETPATLFCRLRRALEHG